jgi:hypothetical protein
MVHKGQGTGILEGWQDGIGKENFFAGWRREAERILEGGGWAHGLMAADS